MNATIQARIDTLQKLIGLILDAIRETPHGMPGGYLYSALMTYGCTLDQFEGIMAGLVQAGKVTKRRDCYFIVREN